MPASDRCCSSPGSAGEDEDPVGVGLFAAVDVSMGANLPQPAGDFPALDSSRHHLPQQQNPHRRQHRRRRHSGAGDLYLEI
eukprot:SAG31_NODE_3038_length_4759_cov_2.556438_6_plen_81_part_00